MFNKSHSYSLIVCRYHATRTVRRLSYPKTTTRWEDYVITNQIHMKKIQVTTAAIKAEAQVIVLNASLVSRIVKSHSELKNVVKNLKSEAQKAVDSNDTFEDKDVTVFYDTTIRCTDINSVDRVFNLLSDLVFAFDEDEDGTAPANDNHSFEGMKIPNKPEPQDC